MSWAPIDFEGWTSIPDTARPFDAHAESNLRDALSKLSLCWNRLRSDIENLFIPSGPVGSHAHDHYHPPDDPAEKQAVLRACSVDFESALVFLRVAADLSIRCLGGTVPFSELANPGWARFAKQAASDPSWPSKEINGSTLFLERTVFSARNLAVVHPAHQVSVTRFDNVGNLIFFRRPGHPGDVTARAERLLQRVLDGFVDPNVTVDPRLEGTSFGPLTVHAALTMIDMSTLPPEDGEIEVRKMVYRGPLAASDWEELRDIRDAAGYELPMPVFVARAANQFARGVSRLMTYSDGRGHPQHL